MQSHVPLHLQLSFGHMYVKHASSSSTSTAENGRLTLGGELFWACARSSRRERGARMRERCRSVQGFERARNNSSRSSRMCRWSYHFLSSFTREEEEESTEFISLLHGAETSPGGLTFLKLAQLLLLTSVKTLVVVNYKEK